MGEDEAIRKLRDLEGTEAEEAADEAIRLLKRARVLVGRALKSPPYKMRCKFTLQVATDLMPGLGPSASRGH